ncbi:MAG: EfeM/EfeO family lipoprotein [Candidatus Promineifilaceae bacterium]
MLSTRSFIVSAVLLLFTLSACSQSAPAEVASAPADGPSANLDAVKTYAMQNAVQMQAGASDLHQTAQAYYDLMAEYGFDYEAAWAANPDELAGLVSDAKAAWITASQYYELDEGIIAGVPSLASYDVWIDAGPSKAEAPSEAREWVLELPDGRELDSPGNFFHSLLEPTIWGTTEEYTGLAVDLDGSGTIELGEALPEANMLLGASAGLDDATAQMIAAIEVWQPTVSDAFTALVVMIPTMNEYFEQWKLSAYVAGETSEEVAFIGSSRLFDITNILNGLNVAYDNVSVLVEEADPDQHAQIVDGFADLRGYVDDLYNQELAGEIFNARQAELFGTEAQDKATSLAGQVAQVAAQLKITIEE